MKKSTFLIFVILSLSACKLSAAQLETRCDGLSPGSEYQYEFLSGKAIVVEKRFSVGDCFEKDCHLGKPAHFFAYIEPSDGERFRVITPTETFETLHPKPLYMEKGKAYSFCARQIEETRSPDHKDKTYKIDFLETIQPLQE